MNILIAILDNDIDDLLIMQNGLAKLGTMVDYTDTTIEGLINKLTDNPTVIVSDYHLDNDDTGVKAMRKIKVIHPLIMFVFVSNDPSRRILIDIIGEGWGCYFIDKNSEGDMTNLNETVLRAKEVLGTKLTAVIREYERQERIRQKAKETLIKLEAQ